MTTSEVLRKARALIEKPENWTQREVARDARGKPIWNPRDERVCKRCTLGAVDAVAESYEQALAMRTVLWEACSMSITDFNDTHTHAEVLSLFDRAIAAAEARGE